MAGTNELDPESLKFRSVYYRIYNRQNGTRYGFTPSPRYDGGRDRGGRQHRPVWPRVLAKLKAHNIDIEHYLEEIMYRFNIESPQDAVRDDYIRMYVNELRQDSSVAEILRSEEKELQDLCKREVHDYKCSEDDAIRRVLTRLTVDISPLTKYIFGMKHHAEDAAGRWLEAAYQQYCQRRVSYDKWCADKIPDSWKNN